MSQISSALTIFHAIKFTTIFITMRHSKISLFIINYIWQKNEHPKLFANANLLYKSFSWEEEDWLLLDDLDFFCLSHLSENGPKLKGPPSPNNDKLMLPAKAAKGLKYGLGLKSGSSLQTWDLPGQWDNPILSMKDLKCHIKTGTILKYWTFCSLHEKKIMWKIKRLNSDDKRPIANGYVLYKIDN